MASWVRQTIGALKDAGNIVYAKLKSKRSDIDIAVLKSTRHNEIPPKENHFLIALAATESSELLHHLRHAVEMRLNRTKNWMVTLKTLALIHRLLRDAQIPIFTHEFEQQHNSSHKVLLASISLHFEDNSSPLSLECSLWVRKYSSYLARRLCCNRILKCADNIVGENKNRLISEDMEAKELLDGLKSLQLLVGCLLKCFPHEISLANNSLIQFILDLLMKECFNIYAALNVCICKLMDEVPTEKVLCLVDVYKRILRESEKKLTKFYHRSCIVVVAHGVHTDNPSPESFSTQIKDYITKYRHRHFEMEDLERSSIHIHLEAEKHDITKKETADKRIPWIQQDKAEETQRDNIAGGVMDESFS